MRYRVRNEHGELQFSSFTELRDAYVHSMVGPEDEVAEEGSTQWQKAGSIPRLVAARSDHPQPWKKAERRWYILAAVLIACAVYFVINGWDYVSFGIAAVLVVGLLAWTTAASVTIRRR